MHVFLTGHTGFKGSWLVMLLNSLGHEVSGLALDPVAGAIYERAGVQRLMAHDYRVDVRDGDAVVQVIRKSRADVVIHMAAQALVRPSYAEPITTMDVNVMGTLNVLRAVASTDSVRTHLVVTTDKVYRHPHETGGRAFVETDHLGGGDPYSASKAMCDIAVQSWCESFSSPPTAIARAGNVIGGGDVSPDRLLTDVSSALMDGRQPVLRFPDAVRPWQHVLDCLAGYVQLIEYLARGEQEQPWSAWNFGPSPASFATVSEVVELAQVVWGGVSGWVLASSPALPEAAFLTLDSTKAEELLGWRNKLSLVDAVRYTMEWNKRVYEGGEDAYAVTLEQVASYGALR